MLRLCRSGQRGLCGGENFFTFAWLETLGGFHSLRAEGKRFLNVVSRNS